ncbi:MAG: ArsR family transcriptional regulator [Meiothermus silvanus]|nr:ArsR family transcriptional regulator [Allomeiothermus silvanus]
MDGLTFARPVLLLAVGLLLLAYLFALVMSAGHLAEWYSLTSGSLPPWFAVGLAAALELTAFLLSLISNALRASPWATWGAVLALGLVWAGNLLSMGRANPALPLWEVVLMSLFVPVATLVVGKVVGDLLRHLPGPEAKATTPVPHLEPQAVQQEPTPQASAPAPVNSTRMIPYPEDLRACTEMTITETHTQQRSVEVRLEPDLARILQIIRERGGVVTRDLVVVVVNSEETAKRRLRALRDRGVIAFDGKVWREVRQGGQEDEL